jgi:hypothetical protein
MRSTVFATFFALAAGCTIQSPPEVTMEPVHRPPPHLPTRTAAECVGVVAPTERTGSIPGFWPAEQFFVVPSIEAPRSQRGKTLAVRFRITAQGTLDSLQVTGATNDTYRAQYMKAIQDIFTRGKYHPAVYQGCAVDTWSAYTVKVDGT